VITALRALMPPRAWARRTAGRRHSDAPTRSVRSVISGWTAAIVPFVAGERPHLTLTVDLDALERRSGRRCELDDVGRIAPEDARRIACDASVSRVITTAPSAPVEIGRRTPIVPAALRRVVVVRDGGCRFPGCDRPPGWCDAHHVVHWADGGEMALGNLLLLCRPHHRKVHERFSLTIEDGRPAFRRPDGTPLHDARFP
jgi:uncharacterized protein DUF222/HNH endonuclease